MQRRSNLYIFGFAALMTAIASILLSLAATVLKPAQELNEKMEVVRNILTVSGMAPDQIAGESPQNLMRIYRDSYEVLLLNKENRPSERNDIESRLAAIGYSREHLARMETFELLQLFNRKLDYLARKSNESPGQYDPGYKLLFLYKPARDVKAYIIPLQGPGLWGEIYGYLALEPDLVTVKGVRFYKDEETPGLGAEIEKGWFTGQFIGKKIMDRHGAFTSVSVAKGKASVTYSGEKLDHYVDGISGATITGKSVTKFIETDLLKYEPYFATLRKGRRIPGGGRS